MEETGRDKDKMSMCSLSVMPSNQTQLLWTQCRGIGPHLVGRGKSHGFSRVLIILLWL